MTPMKKSKSKGEDVIGLDGWDLPDLELLRPLLLKAMTKSLREILSDDPPAMSIWCGQKIEVLLSLPLGPGGNDCVWKVRLADLMDEFMSTVGGDNPELSHKYATQLRDLANRLDALS